MPQAVVADWEEILAQPTLAYEEGLRFFRGKGLMNQTLRQLAADLKTRGIPYSVIGAVALNQHGYRRFTEAIDLLLTKEGLEKFGAELVGRGYRPAFPGATRKFLWRRIIRLASPRHANFSWKPNGPASTSKPSTTRLIKCGAMPTPPNSAYRFTNFPCPPI